MTSKVYVPHSGPESAEILIVGEAPGSDETRLRQPFVGRSGELLRTVLQQNGFPCASAEECEKLGPSANLGYNIRFANLVNFQPEGNKFDNFTEAEVKNGLRELDEYIQRRKANIRICVALGAMPLQYLAHKYGIENWRGSVIEVDGLTILATYHPAYISRVRRYYPIFSLDIGRAHKIYREGYERPKSGFEINPSQMRYYEIIAEIKQAGRVAVDIESIKHTNHILCCGFATSRSKAYCLVNNSAVGGGLDPSFRMFCEHILGDPDIEKIFHNGIYDVEVFFNNSVDIRNFKHDTMIAQHVLAPELDKSLAFITSIYTTIPYYKDKGKMTIPENEKGWSDTKKLDRMTLYEYNCWDAVATFWCMEEMLKEIEEDECFSLIYPQEMDMHEVAFELIRNGMLIDEERRSLLRGIVTQRLIEEQRLLDYCVGASVNVGSPDQKKKLLYETWKLPVRTNEKHKVSTDEDAIVSLIGHTKDHLSGLVREDSKKEWMKKLMGLGCILKIMGYRKLLGSYIDIDIHPDGRVRSTYKITGAETARWSCAKYLDDTGLNAQTMPRESLEYVPG